MKDEKIAISVSAFRFMSFDGKTSEKIKVKLNAVYKGDNNR